jgi:hypothetical protein
MCGTEYDNRDALTNHLVQMHPTQKINDFECSVCGAKFQTIDQLVGHAGSVHPVVAAKQ